MIGRPYSFRVKDLGCQQKHKTITHLRSVVAFSGRKYNCFSGLKLKSRQEKMPRPSKAKKKSMAMVEARKKTTISSIADDLPRYNTCPPPHPVKKLTEPLPL